MWKKLIVLFVTLLSVSSIVCGYYVLQMEAAGGYRAGGTLTGRINQAPAGISGPQIGMKKGDKISLNDNLAMQLIYLDSNYTDYISGDVKNDINIVGLPPNLYNASDGTPTMGTPLTAWYSLATAPIATVTATNGQLFPIYANIGSGYHYLPYSESNIAAAIAGCNVGRGVQLLESIDLGPMREVYSGAY